MTILAGYKSFTGRHWETGTVANYYAYRQVIAPHTSKPYSEALMLGVSGGIVMGYFSFAYKGYDPHTAILTRNTFDPMDTFLERLGIAQHIMQTNNPQTAIKNLIGTLESGLPAIVWTDVFSMPYNGMDDAGMWQMYPILVYGYDEAEDIVHIADRSKVPLTVTTAQLETARGRVKIDKHRIITLGDPNPEKLASAVQKGIWDTIKLFTDKPPKGSKENFGFAAYKRWAELLINPKPKSSWARVFPSGRPFVAGLTSAYYSIILNSICGDAERGQYADFLEEASLILNKPGLKEASPLFRLSGEAWKKLCAALLPDDFPYFRQLRQLIYRKQELFLEKGSEALIEIQEINRQLEERKREAEANFPLRENEMKQLLENLRQHILQTHGIELQAISALQSAIES